MFINTFRIVIRNSADGNLEIEPVVAGNPVLSIYIRAIDIITCPANNHIRAGFILIDRHIDSNLPIGIGFVNGPALGEDPPRATLDVIYIVTGLFCIRRHSRQGS